MSFSLTRKTDYALVALARLAEVATGDEQTLSARQIAEQYDLPASLLMNVLKDLHRAKIITSRRGAGGGYLLGDRPEAITMKQVVEAIEGPVQTALCCTDHENDAEPCEACAVEPNCPITTPMQRFNDRVQNFLEQVTLRDLIDERPYVNLTTTGAKA